MTDSDKPLSHRRRNGSDKRRRTRVVGVRLTQEEYERLDAEAAKRDLTLASYARERLVSEPQVRSRRRPRADAMELARACGKMNRIGSNINQIARVVNLHELPGGHALAQAGSELSQVLGEVRAAMGSKS